MQTDSVSGLNQVVLLLRQQLLSRAGKEKPSIGQSAASGVHGARASRSTKKDLNKVISARLDTLRNSGVKSSHLLKRAFIEQILISGLGDHLVNEARFQEMVDDVLNTLTQDKELGLLLDVLIGPGPMANR
jgi:hypothetical protein